MFASVCDGSQDNMTENLEAQNDQPSEQSVLPPFSGKLNVDQELILSNENFQQNIDDFF
jgi:hypothetical protein